MLAIVVSRADAASEHVGEHLLELADWTAREDSARPDAEGGGQVYRTDGAELREFDALHLEIENAGAAFGTVDDGPDRDPDLLAFASRHAGDTGPLLTAHHTGNLGPAEFGGRDGRLARACPLAHRRVVGSLETHAPEGYDVGMECTHHGPSAVGLPSMFVELGSGSDQWTDPAGARAVARAVLDLRGVSPDAPVESPAGHGDRDGDDAQAEDGAQKGDAAQAEDGAQEGDAAQAEDGAQEAENVQAGHRTQDGPDADGYPARRRQLVGFGGGHYAPRFERVVRETDWAVGHVAADWALEDLGDPAEHPDVIRQVFDESDTTRALIEGAPEVEAVVEDVGFDVVSETWVRETGDTGDGPVPLWLADALEDALCPVDEGLRFGERARSDPAAGATSPTLVDLPTDLLGEARSVDQGAARAAVEATTLAFETAENGARAGGRAVVVDPSDRETLIDGLVAVLAEEYEVERRDDAVIVRETAFDPERARTLGVPEGPEFGRLADGQPVEVAGDRIDPDAVHVERERRVELDR